MLTVFNDLFLCVLFFRVFVIFFVCVHCYRGQGVFCWCHCAVEGTLPDSALCYGVQWVLFFILILLCFVHDLQLKSLFC